MRAIWVWGCSLVAVMAAFLAFVAAGWPGAVDRCVFDTPDSCFCEAFDESDLFRRAADGEIVPVTTPGVRQTANTWFNLYAIVTSLIVAISIMRERDGEPEPTNALRSKALVADVYVFAVLFLGLGSMWFHASLKQWGGVVDGLSMYAYASFLPAYTALRLTGSTTSFWVIYAVAVPVLTVVHALAVAPSWLLVGAPVVAYLALEAVVWGRDTAFAMGRGLTQALWVGAVACFLVAMLFWAFSQTGGPLCDPSSLWQPHALAWHPLAGVMAVLLYFYWREEGRGEEVTAAPTRRPATG